MTWCQGLLILCAFLSTVAQAQWLNYPAPGTPRTHDGKPNLDVPAPRAADGKPDLSGVWRVQPTSRQDLKRIYGPLVDAGEALSVPGMEVDLVNKYFIGVLADFKPSEAPLRPEAVALMRQRAAAGTPMKVCMPAGPFAPYIPDPHKIVQTPTQLVIMYEADNSHRQIYTDGRQLPKEIAQPAWQGYPVGKWDGDTLVVETSGFNDKTGLDVIGHPHGEALHVTERFRRRDFGHMDTERTFDDPQFYTKPFTFKYTEILMPDTGVLEFVCNENEKDNVHSLKQ